MQNQNYTFYQRKFLYVDFKSGIYINLATKCYIGPCAAYRYTFTDPTYCAAHEPSATSTLSTERRTSVYRPAFRVSSSPQNRPIPPHTLHRRWRSALLPSPRSPRDPYELNFQFFLNLRQPQRPLINRVSSFDKRDISGVRVDRAFFSETYGFKITTPVLSFAPEHSTEQRKHTDWELGESDTYTTQKWRHSCSTIRASPRANNKQHRGPAEVAAAASRAEVDPTQLSSPDDVQQGA